MDRRNMLGILGAGATGLVALGGTTRAQQQHEHHEHSKVLDECGDLCGRAAHHCLEQLRKGGPNQEVHARAHELTMDCQQFCALATDLTSRSSPVAHHAHAACAEVCRECAEACEKVGGAQVMQDCAKACREAEKHCRQLAKAGGHVH
jgi:hypothetical protein